MERLPWPWPVVERIAYDPYGRRRLYAGQSLGDPLRRDRLAVVEESPAGNPIGYTGQWLDAETGLYNYRARIYNPRLARFNQRDPMGAMAAVASIPMMRSVGRRFSATWCITVFAQALVAR